MKKLSLITFVVAVLCFASSMIFVLLMTNSRSVGIALCVAGIVCTLFHFIFKTKSEK